MKTSFLPQGFEKLRTEKPYINLSKLPEGEYRFRIVQRPIAGWIDWKDNKPYRFKPENKPKSSFDAEKPMKSFWALHVWDYAKEGLHIMEITQNGIKKSLEDLASNEDWGDLSTFDIKIKKEGAGKETKYSVIPIPPKKISPAIAEAVESTPVRLEALYEGKDPWNDLEASEEEYREPENGISIEQAEQLAALIDQLNDDAHIKALAEHVHVTNIYNMEKKDFDRVIRSIENKIVEKERNSA